MKKRSLLSFLVIGLPAALLALWGLWSTIKNAVKKRSLLSFLVIGLLAALLALWGLWSTIKNAVKKRSLLSFLVIGLLAALLAFCGFWSTIKNAVKKVWRAVKAVVRIVVRVVILVINTFTFGLFDLLLGFLTWPPKKLRLHIFILSDMNGPVVNPSDLTSSIDFAKQTFKDRFNVNLVPYSKNMVEIVKEPAPAPALTPDCVGGGALKNEFGEAGEYYASQLAGWNAIPISLTFPITVFVVHKIHGREGCSLGPLTDYLTLDIGGVASVNTMAHEMGHACSLWHSRSKSNLMWPDDDRGNGAKWFQKNLLRSSRHVQYW